MSERCAIVTGAAQGLGKAVARRLLQDGTSVIGVDIQAEKLAQAAQEFGTLSARFAAVSGDAAKADTAAAAVARALDVAGRIDMLVNCAGGSGTKGIKDIEDLDDDVWDAVLDANLRTTFVFCRAVAPAMRRLGRGRIVNFSSNVTRGVSGPLGTVGARLAYCAAKGGIEAFTRQLARDLGPAGITVNAVVPGFIMTEPGARVRQKYDELNEAERAILLRTPSTGAPGTPADIAAAVAYLVSDAAAQVNGVLLTIGG